jgi:hypothetical protein
MKEKHVVTKAMYNKGLSGKSSILSRSNYGVGGQVEDFDSVQANF